MHFLALVLCFHLMSAVICSSKETPQDEPETPNPDGNIGGGQGNNRSDGPKDKENPGSSSPNSSKSSSKNDSSKSSESHEDDEEEGGGSRDSSYEESEDHDDDGDDRLPQPDISTGQNEVPDTSGILPGNWGANCPQLAQQNMCNNNLYRTIMQRSCKTSCRAQNCLDRRPDLCEAWEKRGFCRIDFYKNSISACKRTCKKCQS